jgi:N-acyl-D-amino-acid deacylase
MYDVLIKKATVVDGTGQASFVADVGISGDKIVDIAPTIPVKARSVVEAEGFVLAPGFVDVQNHSDTYWNLFDNPSLDSLLLQGFTSIYVYSITSSSYGNRLSGNRAGC